MALNLPESATEVVARAKTAVQRALPQSNPFLPNSWLSALITSYSYRIFDFYLQLREAIKQTFFDTSTGDSLERQASWFGITRLAATQSNGFIVATGTAGSTIALNTLYQTSDGLEFKVLALATISDQSISVASITRSGGLATVTTDSEHNLASNVLVTISGANEAQFNVTDAEITVTGENTFTFELPDSGATVATGTILADFTSGHVSVESIDFGQDVNLPLDSIMTLQSPIVGVDDDASVDSQELAGGTDQETDEQLRDRFLDRVQNPVAHFNVAEITAKAKEVNGVTRVFVEEITPAIGQVTIYFTRDNDENIIPTAPEVAAVKDSILTIKPANTSDDDVIVEAPTPVETDFVFNAIAPNTPAMKEAVAANLQQFFLEQTVVGQDVQAVAYNSAIFNTVDSSGQRIQGFDLFAPVGNITVVAGELATLGAVTTP
jgi:uncharacterized phage protein gp47/JayE